MDLLIVIVTTLLIPVVVVGCIFPFLELVEQEMEFEENKRKGGYYWD